MSSISKRLLQDFRTTALEHREKWPYIGAALVCLAIYAFSYSRDEVVHIYQSEKSPDFKDARILGSRGDSIYEGKERLLSKTMRELKETQEALRASNEKLQARLDELEKGKSQGTPVGAPGNSAALNSANGPQPLPSPGLEPAQSGSDSIRTGPPPEVFPVTHISGSSGNTARAFGSSRVKLGNSIMSFPVKDIPIEKTEEITLPAGSYVKAKLMTGVEAPEGKTYPVLLQLDYAYIVPNHHKLDLAGCFMIAKSQGDLSTERVQMQATKLSCVSKAGRMFEREVNGFVADDKDNSFAVIGSVNSKQDRVAAMGFLSSIVEGVGKSIQQAQTTQTVNPLGGTQSILTGNQLEYMGAGGAANAAGMVTQWYLKQAQNLLPTINVGSGQDIWIVMQDTVKLPHDFFRMNTKGANNESVYTYFSRIVD